MIDRVVVNYSGVASVKWIERGLSNHSRICLMTRIGVSTSCCSSSVHAINLIRRSGRAELRAESGPAGPPHPVNNV